MRTRNRFDAGRSVPRESTAASDYAELMNARIADVAQLVGDPARAAMLATLMDGRSLTALELACCAGVTPQTASFHLKKLARKDLLTAVKQGRHRYYRLATPLVAQMLEGIMAVAGATARPVPEPRIDPAMKRARTCYDHLAGTLGVAIADALAERRYVLLDDEGGEVTADGFEFFATHTIEIGTATSGSRVFCRPCLDWSERRPHLAGRIGAALARHFFASNWLRRQRDTRVVDITKAGDAGFQKLLGIKV
jgi:DNA-binding transcriptional ArsR family regulator